MLKTSTTTLEGSDSPVTVHSQSSDAPLIVPATTLEDGLYQKNVTSGDDKLNTFNYSSLLDGARIPTHRPLGDSRFRDSSMLKSKHYAPLLKSGATLIHEKQKRQFCAKHSINNLLQDRASTQEFDHIADSIFENEKQLYYGSIESSSRFSIWLKKKTMKNFHKRKVLFFGSFGNYSYEVVEMILRKKNLSLVSVKLSSLRNNIHAEDIWDLSNPTVIGLLCNLQQYSYGHATCCLPFLSRRYSKERRPVSGHWWSLGKVILQHDTTGEEREVWYNHDSKLSAPEQLPILEDVYRTIQKNYLEMGDDLLVWKIVKDESSSQQDLTGFSDR
ncbi:hypothetical protein FDP41_002454 [Naegleria fowleri]|uniref:ubiquitinyl hydrolase 1 n=1 Tax=Naegleria fowleri TaxID=5763 RepID=A0A6A5BWF5_NAEFO|nr:uncharacterized protein FDP41_002454 [Naegleria fowleri]KAF0978634.1 hypothetical protein FDP41_002454 [Naegleria fowleri]CAG4711357.1 unnamed protein product [Naegleria fowleri]